MWGCSAGSRTPLEYLKKCWVRASSPSEISARLAYARRRFDSSDRRPAIRKIVTDLAGQHPRVAGVRELATAVGHHALIGR
jgi:hypothetical protein